MEVVVAGRSGAAGPAVPVPMENKHPLRVEGTYCPNMVAAVTGECLNGMVRSAFHGQPLGSVPMDDGSLCACRPNVIGSGSPHGVQRVGSTAVNCLKLDSVPMKQHT